MRRLLPPPTPSRVGGRAGRRHGAAGLPTTAALARVTRATRVARASLASLATVATVAALAALAPAATPVAAQDVAIVGGTVHTGTGGVIEGATVLVRNGRIAEVGTAVDVPGGVRRVDAAGMVVTPGLLASESQLGLVEIGAESATADAATTESGLGASFDPTDGLNPRASALAVTVAGGVTRTTIVPSSRALFPGMGVLIDLDGETLDELVTRRPVSIRANLGAGGASLAGGSRAAAARLVRQALADARDGGDDDEDEEDGEEDEGGEDDGEDDLLDPMDDDEALAMVLRREIPLAVAVDRAADIRVALDIADEFAIDIVVVGGAEAWMVADDLAAAGVPVVVNPLTNLPSLESLGATYENAARLREAGVEVVISNRDTNNARNLRQAAGMAVAYGMDHGEALQAVTRVPAETWGAGELLGTLEPGKLGDVVVWSGDPFELSTSVEHVFIDGREVSLESRQDLLFERYRNLGIYRRIGGGGE